MIETLLITFREGLEAFLVVAITLAFINRMGYFHLRMPVYLGIAAALLISATTAFHVAALAQEPVWEGTLALIAGVMVASFTLFVMKTAPSIRGNIHARIQKNADMDNGFAQAGVFIFTVLMVAREGMETALMLGTISAQNNASTMITGAVAGLALVGVIAFLWASQSNKINLKLFMQVTGIFLILFSINLFLYGLHELSEMGSLPFSEGVNNVLHNATEMFAHDSLYAQIVTYSLLAVPCLWLGLSYIRDKFVTKPFPHAAE